MLVLIDNYDSFTYNLAQYFAELGQEVVVHRHDCISLAEIEALAPQYLVISPGPCSPNEAGISLEAIDYFAGKLPILGVCLGHQALAQVFGGKVVRAKQVMHGKTSVIEHNGEGLFKGVVNPLRVTRYHSLLVERESLPECLEVTAWTPSGEIMALAHKNLPISGVQFHPEAILTEQGHLLLLNFLNSVEIFREIDKNDNMSG